MRTIALAYSGGLDTSIIVPWLREHYDAKVICVAADIGQGEELDGVKQKAIASGAAECHVEDLRLEYVRDYIWPTLRAGASSHTLSQNRLHLGRLLHDAISPLAEGTLRFDRLHPPLGGGPLHSFQLVEALRLQNQERRLADGRGWTAWLTILRFSTRLEWRL